MSQITDDFMTSQIHGYKRFLNRHSSNSICHALHAFLSSYPFTSHMRMW